MKRFLLLFLLFPLHSFACSCDQLPVALEFLTAKYVFWGSVIGKEYAKDFRTYTVTLRVNKHFKENKQNPQVLTFTEEAEGSITGHYTSCDFSVNKGENWLVYAYDYNGKLTFSYYCSNSKPYGTLADVRKQELEILEAGNKINVHRIVFERNSSNVGYSKEYQRPEPKVPLDTLLAQLDSKDYESLDDSHFENFIISINSKGKITKVLVLRRRTKNWEIKEVYGVVYAEYTPVDSLNTELQNEIIREIKKGKSWQPATFMGRKVNSQIYIQVYFKRNRKPYASDIY